MNPFILVAKKALTVHKCRTRPSIVAGKSVVCGPYEKQSVRLQTVTGPLNMKTKTF